MLYCRFTPLTRPYFKFSTEHKLGKKMQKKRDLKAKRRFALQMMQLHKCLALRMISNSLFLNIRISCSTCSLFHVKCRFSQAVVYIAVIQIACFTPGLSQAFTVYPYPYRKLTITMIMFYLDT